MVFSFTATGAAPVTIVDPNGDAQTQAAEVNTAGIASVLFTRLVACTQYTWSVTVAAAVAETGVVNTRYAGSSAACPSTTTVAGTMESFIGYEHQGGDTSDFGPDGFGWHRGADLGIGGVEYGFIHTNNGSDSTVRVWRNRLLYTLSNMQMLRGVSSAVFTATANIDSTGNACATNGLPAETTRPVLETPWTPCTNDATWEQWTDGIESCTALVDAPAGAVDRYGSNQPVVVQGNAVSITIDNPAQGIYLGFDAPNDGFPDFQNLDVASNPSFASDGNRAAGDPVSCTLSQSAP
jgi:hypothetical protein